LLLRDKGGEYYEASDIAESAARGLQATKLALGLKPFATAYIDTAPRAPEGYDPSTSGGFFGMNRNYRGRNWDGRIPTASATTGILEWELSRIKSGAYELEPGSYLALLEKQPEMPLGYPRVKEHGSIHIVEGQW
jgi:hypothetical protein